MIIFKKKEEERKKKNYRNEELRAVHNTRNEKKPWRTKYRQRSWQRFTQTG
jgi:hypothetical protein